MTVSETQNGPLTFPVSGKHIRHIGYRPDIDGLRAVAVLSVLFFHAFPALLSGGFVGVDIFFVISGYLISRVILTTLERGTFSIADFYSRRIRRIFPALIVVLAACLAFGWHTMLADDLMQLAKHVLGGATFVSNFVLWGEAGYFDKASELKPLLHLWSLGIEEQFYIIWPLLLWVVWRLRTSLLPIVVIIGLASFILNIVGVHEHATATFYSPLSRGWELIVGATLACFGSRSSPKDGMAVTSTSVIEQMQESQTARTVISIVGALFIAYSIFCIDNTLAFPGKWALFPTIGAALIIVAGPGAWVNRVLLSNRVMIFIGLISFPLYLWHWPLLAFAKSAYPEGLSWSGRLGLLASSVVLATLTYLYIERPFRSGSKTWVKVFILCVSMCMAGVLASVILKSAGVPARYPQIIQRATEYDLDSYRAGLRNLVCFMDVGQDATQYASECVDKGDKPLWVLWGDSDAAALYSGMRGLAERSGQFRLAQFTSSSCPPIVGFHGKNTACKSNNQWTIDKVRELAPDTVILASMWPRYDEELLPATVKQIKEAGVRRVILLGPTPAWKDTPSRIAFNLWSNDPLHRVPSERLDYVKYGMGREQEVNGELDTGTDAAEQTLKRLAERTGAVYISVVQKMCNEKGCLMRESASSGDAFYLDIVHLTPHGSDFVARAIARELDITDH
jgi:peptidoglycan/LPS O-acetylase OafA/YrhL